MIWDALYINVPNPNLISFKTWIHFKDGSQILISIKMEWTLSTIMRIEEDIGVLSSFLN